MNDKRNDWWYNYPLVDKVTVYNPKGVIGDSFPKAADMLNRFQIVRTYGDWDDLMELSDLVDATSLPGYSTEEAIASMEKIVEKAGEIEQAQREEERRVFEAEITLQDLGNRIEDTKITSEKTLKYFQHCAVEEPVKQIFKQLSREPLIKEDFDLKDGFHFDHYFDQFNDTEEVFNQNVAQSNADPMQLHRNQTYAYQWEQSPSIQSMLYVIEYKAPQKLTRELLRAGLRPMNLIDEVVHQVTTPASSEENARFQYDADRTVAAALTQTFHYMIESQLDYGMLTTGEAMVFLKIDWDDPTVLYYHLIEPSFKTSPADSVGYSDSSLYYTAVGCILAFSLMALLTTRRIYSHDTFQRLTKPIQFWSIPHEILSKTSKTGRIVQSSSRQELGHEKKQDKSGKESSLTQEIRQKKTNESSHHPQYCTQKCLLGLVREQDLDNNCPNVMLHRGHGDIAFHPVSHTEWLQLLKEQLGRSLDDGVVRLHIEGSRGVLFQVTLLEYGYTFISKATIRAFVPDLKHEAAVYDRLQSKQGIQIPVHLGSVDLDEVSSTYYYDPGVYIIYMMFLSWGGQNIYKPDNSALAGVDLKKELSLLVQSFHDMGIIHNDIREQNVLWNQENQNFMVIDFERSDLLCQPLTTNKRDNSGELESISDEPELPSDQRKQRLYKRRMALDMITINSLRTV